MNSEIANILDIIKSNTIKGSKTFYRPLSRGQSEKIRNYYLSCLKIDVNGNNNISFYNNCGILVAVGYKRVVIGDYGPYIEFDDIQIKHDSIENKWSSVPKRKVKYIWMQTRDQAKTKIYRQCGTVSYADYKIGMYYVDPRDLHTDYLECLYGV